MSLEMRALAKITLLYLLFLASLTEMSFPLAVGYSVYTAFLLGMSSERPRFSLFAHITEMAAQLTAVVVNLIT